jgi:hypothetical protein
MAIKYIENVGSAAGDAASELSRLKGLSGGNVIPVIFDAVDGALKFYDRVNSVVQQVLGVVTPPISATGATLALTAALHAGRTVVANRAAGVAFTLPAATGSGAKFRVVVGTTLTSGSLSVAVASNTDFMRGVALFETDDAANVPQTFPTANTGTVATESDTITMNRTTTGLATAGDYIEVEDIASAIWAVKVVCAASGTEATPFSVAV